MTMGDEARDARLPPSDIKMSLVVVSPGNYSTIRMTVSFLAEQTMCGLLELVIVAPSRDELGLLVSEVAGFHSVQIIEVGAVVFRGRASAAGVRAARGPIVAMVENHAFPQRGWAEALVEAHDGPWVGVCPQIEIFNPKTVCSRAERIIDYGTWVGHDTSREIARLPWHNASYKRDALMQYDGELESLLEPEEALQRRLRDGGCRFYLEARARLMHVSDSIPRSALKGSFYRGRDFAAERSRDLESGSQGHVCALLSGLPGPTTAVVAPELPTFQQEASCPAPGPRSPRVARRHRGRGMCGIPVRRRRRRPLDGSPRV